MQTGGWWNVDLEDVVAGRVQRSHAEAEAAAKQRRKRTSSSRVDGDDNDDDDVDGKRTRVAAVNAAVSQLGPNATVSEALAALSVDRSNRWFVSEPAVVGSAGELTPAQAARATIGGHLWLQRSEVLQHIRLKGGPTGISIVAAERACFRAALCEEGRAAGVGLCSDDIALLRLDKYVQQVQDKVHQWPEKGKAGQYKKLPNKRVAAAAGSKRKRGAVCHPAHTHPPLPSSSVRTRRRRTRRRRRRHRRSTQRTRARPLHVSM